MAGHRARQPQLTFHELKPGAHKIEVVLAEMTTVLWASADPNVTVPERTYKLALIARTIYKAS
jgi:hypothetical protein